MKTAAKAHAPDTIIEQASDLVATNYWLKIGLTRSQLALIKRLAKDYGFEESPSAHMARQLVMMALINLPLIERTWNATVKYCEAEDIVMQEYLEDRARQVVDSLL